MISALLGALLLGELLPTVLAFAGVTGRAAIAAKVAARVLPTVAPPVAKAILEGVRALGERRDLTPDELAVVAHVRAQTIRDLGGPMDKFA